MTYDARAIDGMLAVQIQRLTGYESESVDETADIRALKAVESNDPNALDPVKPYDAFLLGWNFAVKAVAAMLSNPFDDGSGLEPVIADARAQLKSGVERVRSDDELEAACRARALAN
jgi:hypothetical protein